MSVEPPQPATTSWADDDDVDFLEDDGQTLRFETPVDENGIKTITDIQYRDGKKIKVTKKVRVVKKVVRVNTRAVERLKKWKKFGKATANDPSITVVERDPAVFSISGKNKTLAEKGIDREIEKMIRASQAKEKGMEASDAFKPSSLRPGGRSRFADAGPAAKPAAVDPNTYKPPSKRGGVDAGGSRMGARDDGTYTVRVSNLSEDIKEQDLRDLFGTYGRLQRVFLAKDRETNESKGFAFVNFFDRADAEKAIEKVSGFGYGHLILQVEWARR
eukprot:NODE_4714_length_1027_cov_22.165929_g4510_i0.p1 GENE.NODE_4714_length_1027_cov_22.165929_g4510_i0~~NODE_4714_length_1027_cov_22.165929_g4510_i0.p1  ORF type:complete len:274 (-),score=76.71 NODE_4714_length_1027_cov_22.165929_g4510_i0:158-979(-)